MPECGNCGRHVSEEYERVFLPDDRETVRCCPECDVMRDGPDTRKKRSAGGDARGLDDEPFAVDDETTSETVRADGGSDGLWTEVDR